MWRSFSAVQTVWRSGRDSIAAISRKPRRNLRLAILTSVYAAFKHIRNFGYSFYSFPIRLFPRKWYQSVSVVLDPGAGDATNGSATIAMTMEQATVAPTQLTIDVEATPPPPQAAGSR